MSRTRRPNITDHDLMDTNEVADALGVKPSSLLVALSSPAVHPTLAARLPDPLRKVGNAWVWLRYDVEKAVAS